VSHPEHGRRPANAGGAKSGEFAGQEGYVIQTTAIPAEVEALAEKLARAIEANGERMVASLGKVTFVAHREQGRFERLDYTSTVAIWPQARSFQRASLPRLADDVRAKVLANAAAISPSARRVEIAIVGKGTAYDLSLKVDY
jgi:hypothetical protein